MARGPGFWKGKRVLVIGGKGFLGSKLAERLQSEGALVSVSDKNNDIRDPQQIAGLFDKIDTVYHLAAIVNMPYAYAHPFETFEVNVLGTLNVLACAHKAKCRRLIFTSTAHVYGNPSRPAVDETHPLQPVSPYAQSKLLAEQACNYFSKHLGLPVTVLRFFNIYGEGQAGDYLIPVIASQLSGDKVALKDFDSRRDYLYVDDAVNALVLAGESGTSGKAYNIGNGESHSAKEIADMMVEISGKKIPVVLQKSEKFVVSIHELRADPHLAEKELGWKPHTALKDGLKRVIAAWRG